MNFKTAFLKICTIQAIHVGQIYKKFTLLLYTLLLLAGCMFFLLMQALILNEKLMKDYILSLLSFPCAILSSHTATHTREIPLSPPSSFQDDEKVKSKRNKALFRHSPLLAQSG